MLKNMCYRTFACYKTIGTWFGIIFRIIIWVNVLSGGNISTNALGQ